MCRCFEWDAWYDQMPGADHDVLHVAGKCEVSSSSTELELEPTNEGIVDDPELFVLRLVVKKSPVGDTMMATKEVSGRWPEAGIKRVEIRVPDAEPANVPVRDVNGGS
jgi:hypothetical protein